MTSKQRKFVQAVREGLGLEEAAERVGYGVAYAAKLLEEPAIRAAIDAPDQPEPEPPKAMTPREHLQNMVEDADVDNRVRITALRAMAQIDRDAGPPPKPAAVLIDDLDCWHCPLLDLLGQVVGDRQKVHDWNIAGHMKLWKEGAYDRR